MPRRRIVSYDRREFNNPHGSELPTSKRYSEGITSTTQGRGVITQVGKFGDHGAEFIYTPVHSLGGNWLDH